MLIESCHSLTRSQGGNNNAGALGLTLTRIDEFSRAEEESGVWLGIGRESSSSIVPYVTHFMAHAPIVDGSPAMIEVDRAAPRLASNLSGTTGGTVTKVIGCGFAVASLSLSARFGFTSASVTTWESDSSVIHKVSSGVGSGSSPHTLCRLRIYSFAHVNFFFAQELRLFCLPANDAYLHPFHQHFRTSFQL